MPSYKFDRPIPGQSLTTEPRNAPFERPPEIVDPEEALQVHLTKLNKPEAIEDAMFYLELGVDIRTLTEGILRSAVMNGIHTIDVSLIIAPVVHQFIKSAADELGVKYDEGFEDKDKEYNMYVRRKTIALKRLKEMDQQPDTSGVTLRKPTKAKTKDAKVDDRQVEMDLGEVQPKGLMSREEV